MAPPPSGSETPTPPLHSPPKVKVLDGARVLRDAGHESRVEGVRGIVDPSRVGAVLVNQRDGQGLFVVGCDGTRSARLLLSWLLTNLHAHRGWVGRAYVDGLLIPAQGGGDGRADKGHLVEDVGLAGEDVEEGRVGDGELEAGLGLACDAMHRVCGGA